MPFKGVHSARIKSPGQYDQIKFKKDAFGDGIDVLYGIKNGKSEVQALRFDKKKFTVSQAKQWLKKHKYNPIEFEQAESMKTQNEQGKESNPGMQGLEELIEKGRIISTANESKLRQAVQTIQNILSQLEKSSESYKERWKSDLHMLLRNTLNEKYPNMSVYVIDFDESNVIYDVDSKDNSNTYKVNYTVDEKNQVTFGDPVEVVRKTTYVPKEQSTQESEQSEESEETELNESGELLIEENPVKLVEALNQNNEADIKIIQPGWGSSGYYGKEVLQRDAGNYKPGTLMFWDHQTTKEEKERPEGSLKNLVGKLVKAGEYRENGKDGPGVYSRVKVYNQYRDAVKEMGKDIGISHRAYGKRKKGIAEGRNGDIIENINSVKSVDFVTIPGAGGKVVELFESYKEKSNNNNENSNEMSTEEKTKLEERLQTLEADKNRLEKENKRFKEAQLITEAGKFLDNQLKDVKLPDITKRRLKENLTGNPIEKDGKLDEEKMKEAVNKAVKAEVEYLASLTESGEIKGLGEPGNLDESDPELSKKLTEAFSNLMGDENLAKVAATGR